MKKQTDLGYIFHRIKLRDLWLAEDHPGWRLAGRHLPWVIFGVTRTTFTPSATLMPAAHERLFQAIFKPTARLDWNWLEIDQIRRSFADICREEWAISVVAWTIGPIGLLPNRCIVVACMRFIKAAITSAIVVNATEAKNLSSKFICGSSLSMTSDDYEERWHQTCFASHIVMFPIDPTRWNSLIIACFLLQLHLLLIKRQSPGVPAQGAISPQKPPPTSLNPIKLESSMILKMFLREIQFLLFLFILSCNRQSDVHLDPYGYTKYCNNDAWHDLVS